VKRRLPQRSARGSGAGARYGDAETNTGLSAAAAPGRANAGSNGYVLVNTGRS